MRSRGAIADFRAARRRLRAQATEKATGRARACARRPRARALRRVLAAQARPRRRRAATMRDFLAREAGTPLADQLRATGSSRSASRGSGTLFGEELVQDGRARTPSSPACGQYRRQREGDTAMVAVKPLWFTGRSQPESCAPLFARCSRRASSRRRTDARGCALPRRGRQRPPRAGASAPRCRRASGIAERDFARVDRDPLAALRQGEFVLRQPAGRELALYAVERAARKDPRATRAAWVKLRPLARPRPTGSMATAASRSTRRGSSSPTPTCGTARPRARRCPTSSTRGACARRSARRTWATCGGDRRDARGTRAGSGVAVLARPRATPPTGVARRRSGSSRSWRRSSTSTACWPRRRSACRSRRRRAPRRRAGGAGRVRREARGVAGRQARAAGHAHGVAARVDAGAAWRGRRPAAGRRRVRAPRRGCTTARSTPPTARSPATTSRCAISRRTSRNSPPRRRGHDVDEAVLFAIARQESRFIADIVSSAGAQGLMQIMPATARWIAKQLGDSGYRPSQITDPEINTRYGAFYFRHLLDRLDNQPALAAAAYNAGPGRAQAWRPAAPLEGAAWVETIPFNETRDYVKKVLANLMFYSHALGRPAQPLTARLATVAPRSGERQRARGHALTVVPMPKNVLVLGGTGFVGRHIVPKLVAAGHRVVVPTRSRDRARPLFPLPTCTIIEADIHDRARARQACPRLRRGRQPGRHPARGRARDVRARARRPDAQCDRRLQGCGGAAARPHERAERRARRPEPLPALEGRGRGAGHGVGPRLDHLPSQRDLRPRRLLPVDVREARRR